MIEKISKFNWPDTITVPDGWDQTSIPDVTRGNLEFLADKFNSLLDVVYGAENLCPCGSGDKYKDCCGEI